MAKSIKHFEKYFVDAPGAHLTTLDAYAVCPAAAFLISVCDAHDAFVHCLNKFTKKANGDYN